MRKLSVIASQNSFQRLEIVPRKNSKEALNNNRYSQNTWNIGRLKSDLRWLLPILPGWGLHNQVEILLIPFFRRASGVRAVHVLMEAYPAFAK